jgi:CheY-like chemotaxis protein
VLHIGPEISEAENEPLSNVIAKQNRKTKFKTLGATGPSILVVDDHRSIADTTSAILNRSGFRAVATYDGRTALHLTEVLRPDYVLTDVMMPSMNGIELAIAVRRIQPETTIVLFSGQAVTKDLLEEARKEGYEFDLLLKPIHPEDLIRHLRGTEQVIVELSSAREDVEQIYAHTLFAKDSPGGLAPG